jgi:pentapeptide MXKDX repeat protein
MKTRILFVAATAVGLALAPAAFAQSSVSNDTMKKDGMSKTDKMDKMDKKDGMKRTDAMGGDKMKKDEMKK